MKNNHRLAVLILLALLSVVFSGCKSSAPEKPLPTVTVSKATEQNLIEWNEFSGRLESPQVANIAARVTGIITDAPYTEGSAVKENDILFVIDDRPFKAALASKDADVAKAQALFTKADLRLKRYQKVRTTGAVSEDDLDQATADFKEAQSSLEAAKAAADLARLEVEWTHVRAPISGQVSRKLVTEGNNVIGGSGNLTQLTIITSIDPLYAYISVPENQFHKYHFSQTSIYDSAAGTQCQFKLENDSEFKQGCFVNFIDSKVNTDTGTVQLRGVIPNPESILKPGMFVRMRLPAGDAHQQILIPDIAIGADQDSRYLLVVNADGVVESKPVKLGAKFDKLRAIREGITLNDRIIINGMQLARAGSKVNAIEAPVATQISSQSAGAK